MAERRERGSTVSFGMFTPQTPSTSFDLNDFMAMDYAGAEARENMENGGLWRLQEPIRAVTIFTIVHSGLLFIVYCQCLGNRFVLSG